MKTKCMEFLAKICDFSILDVGFLLHLFLSMMELINVLEQYGFSPREAKVYLAVLELWIAPASSIARRLDENRVTVYSVLKSLKKKGIAYETQKWGTSYYGVIEPEKLLEQQKEKIRKLEEKMPEFIALANVWWVKPKVYYFEWLEWIKQVFKKVIIDGTKENVEDGAFVFVWTTHIHPEVEEYIQKEYVPRRMQYPLKVKAIYAHNTPNRYHQKETNLHQNIYIQDTVFDMEDEIILYGQNKIAFIMYDTEELSALIIESRSIYKALLWIFKLVRKHHQWWAKNYFLHYKNHGRK